MLRLKTVIGLTGMPGSGKGVISNLARDLRIPVVVMGDIVREEVSREGLPPTPRNVGKTMLKLRSIFGDTIVAERCVPRIESSDSPLVLVEGIRSLEEVDFFRKMFPRFELVVVHSSPQTRLERLRKRRRSDDADDRNLFNERDRRELWVGIGAAIALADHIFINEGRLDLFKSEVKAYLRKVISRAGSDG